MTSLPFLQPPDLLSSTSTRPFLSLTVCCHAQTTPSRKGFGNAEKKGKKHGSAGKCTKVKGGEKRAIAVREGSKQLQTVLNRVDQECSADQAKKLGIDPDAAAKGKVDFVRVEAWGADGTEAALENLKMKSFSPAFSSEEGAVPFYEQLVRRLQLLESKGEIAVAQGPPLPPFEHWSFGEERYIQFLQDQLSVHRALKHVIASVKKSESSNDIPLVDNNAPSTSRAARAIITFDSRLGLDRHEELASDIAALSGAASRIGVPLNSATPTTQTTAYTKYIEQIGRNAADKSKDTTEGCLRLLAHIFAIHVAHLTTGMRVGAKAVECLPILKEARAVSFYRDYPQQARDPLRVLKGALNTAGSYLNFPEECEEVMQELPNAIQRTSLMLSVLAVEEPLRVN